MTLPIASNVRCFQCGAELAPTLLACPTCGALVHAARLEQLAGAARLASERGDLGAALAAWREALVLLPPDSRQRQVVSAKIAELSRTVGGSARPAAAPGQTSASAGKKAAAGLGALGLLLWKFKVALIFIATKGKLLLLGLTKASTIFSMLLSLGVYWTIWGWKFALGLVLSIYVHEMGHVVALRKYGVKASAPLFLPGLGAVILARQHPSSPREDAEIGLAGPIYGLGAAVASLGLWLATKQPIFVAIAVAGAWINLFNLLPIWPLDGGRAFRALSRPQRLFATAAVAASWFAVQDGMLILLLIVTAARSLEKGDPDGDRRATTHYVLVVIMLSLICLLRPMTSGRV